MNDLMDLYYGMANLTDIEDMEDYARGWRELAEMFEAEGRPSMAETCRSRAVYYGAHPAGGYKRVFQGESLAELIRIS